jgi:hypothetical protein
MSGDMSSRQRQDQARRVGFIFKALL